MPSSFTRTLKLKVRPESYGWLSAAAVEANQVFNYCNQTSLQAVTRTDLKRKWLSGFDLCLLTSGASEFFFESERLQGVKWKQGCFAQDAVGDWWLCLPVEYEVEPNVAPDEWVGIDLGLKETAVTSEGERLECGRFYRGLEAKIAQAQRRGHKRQAKRLHRKAARRRADALHKFSRKIIDQYEYIVVGDVSSSKLAKTRMAKSVLDSGWGMLKRMLHYKGEHAGRSVAVVSERNTTRACSFCGTLSGPTGQDMLVVRHWECSECGAEHDRDRNSARNILGVGLRSRASVCGNELTHTMIPIEPDRPVCARYGIGMWYATA